MKMWSGRFRQPLDPEFEKWQRSFPYDQRLLPFELAASRAHANALEHAGVLSGEEISEVVEGLNQIGRLAESSPEFLNDPEADRPGSRHRSADPRTAKEAPNLGSICGRC